MRPIVALLITVLAGTALLIPGPALAQADCPGVRVIIEGGEPSPFVLPDMQGQTLTLTPDAVVTVSAEGVEPGSSLRLWALFLGQRVASYEFRDVGSGTMTVDISPYTAHLRGAYEVEAVLTLPTGRTCSWRATVSIPGPVLESTAGKVATGTAGAAGVATAVAGAQSIQAMRLKVKVQLARRRRRGWRRFIPVIAWWRTIFSTLLGAVTALLVNVVVQQGGAEPLTLLQGVRSALIGGGVSLGVTVGLGSVINFLKPPVDEGPKGQAPDSKARTRPPEGRREEAPEEGPTGEDSPGRGAEEAPETAEEAEDRGASDEGRSEP